MNEDKVSEKTIIEMVETLMSLGITDEDFQDTILSILITEEDFMEMMKYLQTLTPETMPNFRTIEDKAAEISGNYGD